MTDSIIMLSVIKSKCWRGFHAVFLHVFVMLFGMDANRESQLEVEIGKVKEELSGLGDLRPGSLSTQFNVCGSPNCKCKADPPQKHGPYFQVSFTRKGKGSTKFVKEDDLPAIREQLKNYERMKELIDKWIELSMELSNLRLARHKV